MIPSVDEIGIGFKADADEERFRWKVFDSFSRLALNVVKDFSLLSLFQLRKIDEL